jgi:hypothetical protein
MTLLTYLLEKTIEKPWDYSDYGLSANFSITLEFIEKYIDKPWIWHDYGLSLNRVIVPEFVEKHFDKPWCWNKNGLSRNISITMDFVERNINKPWEWGIYGLSLNGSINDDFVEKFIDKPWFWGNFGLSNNPSISLEFVEKYIDKPWCFESLLTNPNMTPEFIKRHLDKDWSLLNLDLNENTDDDQIQLRLMRINKSFRNVFYSTSVYYSVYEKNLYNFFDRRNQPINKYNYICRSVNLNKKILNKYIDKEINWFLLSNNSALDPFFIIEKKDLPWCWDSLSSNTFGIAEKNYKNKKEEAARIIQRNCNNWLWKPICNDGKLGINPRLSLKLFKLD